MQTYKEFQPTSFDSRSNFMAHSDISYLADWIVVPTSKNRDSIAYEESNFDSALEILGGESDLVEVHRFGHWACGWYELILVHPDLIDKVKEIADRLDNYPLLNEDDAIEREYMIACKYWERISIRERLEVIEQYGNGEVSIFEARHDYLPSGLVISAMGF